MPVSHDYVALVREYGSLRKAAKAIGIAYATFHLRHDAQVSGRPIAERLQGANVPPPQPTASPEQVDHVNARRLANQIADLRKANAELADRAVRAEDQVAAMRGLSSAIVPPPVWAPSPLIKRSTRLLPILFTSDFQCGEVIRAEEIDGMNAYNKDIFAERYESLINSTIDIADHHTGRAEYPGCYYLRGGDAISGGIHAELKDTDDLSAVPAIQHLLKYEREGIRRLRAKFGRVRVVSIPGNHGRLMGPWGVKPRSKGYVEHSIETLLAWWLGSQFDNDPQVEFFTPTSGDAYFDVEGWKFLLAHGDRMGSRGGAGFVGPAATIARGHQKLAQSWEASGRPVNYILTGHLHTSLKLQRGYANGSLAGFGEFARDIQALPDAAKQWLLFGHETRGVAQAFEVQVSARPERIAHTRHSSAF